MMFFGDPIRPSSPTFGARWSAALLAIGLALPVLHGAPQAVEDLYEQAERSVMTLAVENLQGESFIGAGFLMFEHDLALTAWHVIHDARQIQARFSNGETISVLGCVDRDPARDLALIKLAKPLSHRPLLRVTESPPRTGASVYLIGAPKGHEFSICSGLLSQQRYIDGIFHYQLACPISPGNSGGPVLNPAGEVVGLVSWRQREGESIGFAIPATTFDSLTVSNTVVQWAAMTDDSRPGRGNAFRSASTFRSEVMSATPAGSAEFRRFIAERPGRTITVVCTEEGQTYRFEITDGLKE